MDTYLFFLINHGLQNNVFDIAMPFITNKGYVFFIAVVIPLFFQDWRKGLLVFILCIFGFIIADNSVDLLKSLFARPRPYNELQNVRLLIACPGSFSFPSGHAATSAVMASIVGHFSRRAAIPAFVIAALVVFSRIYVGVHYPSDVIGGAILGGVSGGVILLIHKRIVVYLKK
ncbi:MAG: phosphatase PAP2 family protein [Nitrospirae bacterium]|nr:phosphatase PAP2 family protein [Nitrospirota bacterium]